MYKNIYFCKKNNILSLLFATYSFLLSYFIFPFYTDGDQVFYRGFYESIQTYDFYDGFLFYTSALGSKEPAYYVLIYFLSGFFAKDVLMSLLNAVFGLLLSRALLRKNVSIIVVLLLFFNFYLLVIFFPAERLKLGLLLYLMALNFEKFPRNILFGFSIISHIQVGILIMANMLASYANNFTSIFKGRVNRGALLNLTAVLPLAVLLFLLRDHIISKFGFYSKSNSGIFDLFKPIFFVIITLIYARNKKLEALAMHALLLVAVIFLGPERIVIFSYFIFMFYAVQVNRGLNIGVLLVSGYFFFMGLIFIANIFTYGNGFHGS